MGSLGLAVCESERMRRLSVLVHRFIDFFRLDGMCDRCWEQFFNEFEDYI
jgi:hypothetical protein